jgi:hypothetical protein
MLLAGFTSYDRAKDRIRQLHYGAYLRRCFIGTISGGKRAVYCISPKSAALLGVSAPRPRFRQDELVTSDQYIAHQLHITERYLDTAYRNLPKGISFVRWRKFVAPLSEGLGLIPDAYFELNTPSGLRAMFLEVDLGNEALRVWQQKTQRYLQLAVSGDFQKLSGQSQFRVLVVVNTERRLLYIRAKVAAATEKIFWFATLGEIAERGLWAPIWLRPTGNSRVSLL